jgi:hypothetical protein
MTLRFRKPSQGAQETMTHRQTSLRPEQGGKFHPPVVPKEVPAGFARTEGDSAALTKRLITQVEPQGEFVTADRLAEVARRELGLLLHSAGTDRESLVYPYTFVDEWRRVAAVVPVGYGAHNAIRATDAQLVDIIRAELIPEGKRQPSDSTSEVMQTLHRVAKDLHIELDPVMTWEAAFERLYDAGVKRGRSRHAVKPAHFGLEDPRERVEAEGGHVFTGARAKISIQGATGYSDVRSPEPGDVAVSINGRETFTKAPTRFVRPLKDIAATLEKAKQEGKKSVSVAWLEKVYRYMTE